MMRLLFWIALLVLVIAAVRSKIRGKIRGKIREMTPPPGERGAARPIRELGATVECAHCHVYFPESEAVTVNGRVYCSPEHVNLPPA